MSYKDYYEVLGVARGVSQDDLQKAYKKLARKHHPDVDKTAGAEDRFKQINEANDVLKDPKKRALYDKYGQAWKAISEGHAPPPGADQARFDFRDMGIDGFGGQIDPNDLGSIFEQFFANQGQAGPGAGGFGGRRRQRGPVKGDDRESTLDIGVADAFEGGTRDLAIREPDSGQTTRLSVRIPGGVRSGQRIRLAGKGAAGMNGGPPGDLFLEVRVVSDGRYRVEGEDLHVDLPITPWEAALGASIALRTLDGEVRLKIPAGSSSGRSIRLREKGYPRKEGERGDLYAVVQIAVPATLSEKEKELFEELKKESQFDPRAG